MCRELTGRWSLTETVRQLRAEQTSPLVLLERALDRIKDVDTQIEAWVRVDADSARRLAGSAGLSADHGPLWGVPFGVKDIIDLAGLPTECGSSLRAGSPPAQADAAIVRRLRERGAIPLGKTVTTEFAYFAPGPTRNPAQPEHTPGGSSSGSAAAIAAGMVPLAIGSQTAGSLTRPAAYCGVAGLVFTTGSVSSEGVVGLSPSFDTLGLLAATTGDLYTAWAAAFAGVPELERAVGTNRAAGTVAGHRLLLWHPLHLGGLDASMSAALVQAGSCLARAGARIRPLELDEQIARLADDHATVMAYEAARERRAELERATELSEPLAELLRRGSQLSGRDYESAQRRIYAARSVVGDLLAYHDAILGPAALGPAPEGLATTGTPILSRPWQALGLPVVTIPGLIDQHGLPLGLQLIGRHYDEEHLLRVATSIERHLSRLLNSPPARVSDQGRAEWALGRSLPRAGSEP